MPGDPIASVQVSLNHLDSSGTTGFSGNLQQFSENCRWLLRTDVASIMRDRVPGSWRTRCGSSPCNPTGMRGEILDPDGGPNTNRPGDRLRRLHPSRGRVQRQDRQVQPRGRQACHPAGHEELAGHCRDHRTEGQGRAPLLPSERREKPRRREVPGSRNLSAPPPAEPNPRRHGPERCRASLPPTPDQAVRGIGEVQSPLDLKTPSLGQLNRLPL